MDLSELKALEQDVKGRRAGPNEAILRFIKLMKDHYEQVPGNPVHSDELPPCVGIDPAFVFAGRSSEQSAPIGSGVGVHSSAGHPRSVWDWLTEPQRDLLRDLEQPGTNPYDLEILRSLVDDLHDMVLARRDPGSGDDGGGEPKQETANDTGGVPPDDGFMADATYTGLQAKLSKWEMQILLEVGGWVPASKWGGAVGATIEYLHGLNLIRKGKLTKTGYQFIVHRAMREMTL